MNTTERPGPLLGEHLRAMGSSVFALQVRDLTVSFEGEGGKVIANSGISYDLRRGETLAVVGESGSGKSVSANAVAGLLDSTATVTGKVYFEGLDLMTVTGEHRARVRGTGIGMVFQDASTALNPVRTIGSQISELLRVRKGMTRRQATIRVIELLRRVGLPSPESQAKAYPHQLSGGMRQRAMIAAVLALEPRVLIADEPTTALDVTIQAQIVDMLRQLQASTQMSIVFITHDIGLAATLAEGLVVMYGGRVVESGRFKEVVRRPMHPYTRALVNAVPSTSRRSQIIPIPGHPPSLVSPEEGCAFAPRCPQRVPEVCDRTTPILMSAAGRMADRQHACHFPLTQIRDDGGRAPK